MLSFARTVCLAMLLLFFGAASGVAQNPPEGAAALTRRILAVTGAHPALGLTFQNNSSLGVVEAAALRTAIEQNLRSAGATVNASLQTPFSVAVTLAESWRNFLLVAQIHWAEGERTVMVQLPRSAFLPSSTAAPAPVMALVPRMIWRQTEPFLSFSEWKPAGGNSSLLAILEPGSLVVYGRAQGRWQRQSSAQISHEGPFPRDSRGLLWMAPQGAAQGVGSDSITWALDAALPGVTCAATLPLATGRISLTCTPAPATGTPFPIFEGKETLGTATLAPGRNDFLSNIQLGPATVALTSFFSAAIVLDDTGHETLIVAGTDGQAHLYDGAGKSGGTIPGWGSNIAGIESGCGTGWQILASRPGDWTQNDSLAAYEIIDGKAVPTGEPIDFPGPVLALATAPDGTSAQAVVLDRNSGLYDAYAISLSCNH